MQTWPDPLPQGTERAPRPERTRNDPAWAACKRYAFTSLLIGLALIAVALVCLKVTV